MNFSKFVYFICGLILSAWLAASTTVWAAGSPALITITSGDDISVVAINFDKAYSDAEVNEFYDLIVFAYNLLGVDGTVGLFSPDQIKSVGYDGDSLHDLAISVLSELDSYIQIKVGKFTISKRQVHVLDIWSWSPGDTSGFYFGNLEIPDELPLGELLTLLSAGSRYINIVTYDAYNNGIAQVGRFEFYYQETITSEKTYLAAIEISEAAFQSIFSAIFSSGLDFSGL